MKNERDFMNKTFSKIIAIASVVLCMTLLTAYAVPTVNTPETFEISGINGWTNSPGDFGGATNVAVDTIGGRTAVRIMFGPLGVPANQDVKVFADTNASSGNFTGDYTWLNTMGGGARFKFYSQDFATESDTLALFFHSSISNITWQYAFTGTSAVGLPWTTYGAPMSYSAGWESPELGIDKNATAFLADLASVDQIGILVSRSADLGAQDYGLDDFELFIPEPSTYAILAFTLLTLGLTLRRKRLIPVRLAGR